MSSETELYIKQIEDELIRLKCANKSLRDNNRALLESVNKLTKQRNEWKRKHENLSQKTIN